MNAAPVTITGSRIRTLGQRAAHAVALLLATSIGTQAQVIDLQVQVQPVRVCDDAGNSCQTVAYEIAALDKIFSQAGIDVSVLPIVQLNDSTKLAIGSDIELFVVDDVGYRTARGLNTNPGVILALYVQSITGANGLAGVGSATLALDPAAAVVSGALAHEMGHLMGLGHEVDSKNLMVVPTPSATLDNIFPDGSDFYELSPLQRSTIRTQGQTSGMLSAVPEPSSYAAVSALVLLLWATARKTNHRPCAS